MGRDEELAVLTRCLVAPPALVHIEGEAGIGKTRLVQELLAHPELRERRILIGHCHNVRHPFPLGPVIEALRALADEPIGPLRNPVAGAVGPLLPELGALLPPPPEPLGDPRAERHRLLRGVRDVLESIGPAVLVLEDLHWADSATLELLQVLAPQMPTELAVVMTFRREDLPSPSPLAVLASRQVLGVHNAAIALPPLAPDGVAGLVSGILGTDEVSEPFAQHLHARTSGVPLAVEEAIKLLRDRRDLVRAGDRWARRALETLQVPAAIKDSIAERMAMLPAAARRLVQAAAILGEPAEERLLAGVASVPAARRMNALGAALSSGLLHEAAPGTYGLRHALAVQAVSSTIHGPERRLMHERAGRALDSSGTAPAARLAHHFREAGQARRWLRAAEEAADAASSLGDDAAAADVYREMLGSPMLPRSTRARVAVKLGRAALHGMAHADAVAHLREIIAEGGLPKAVRGEVRVYLAWLVDQCGDSATCFEEMAKAVPDLAARPDLTARVLSNLALPIVLDGHVRDHLSSLGRAMRVLDRVRDEETRVAVLVNRAAALLWVGDPEGWRAVADIPWHGVSMQERRQLVRGCVNLAQAALALGHTDHAVSFLEQAASISEELGYERFAGTRAAVALEIAWSTGAWSDLDERAQRMAGDPDSVACVQWPAELVRGRLAMADGRATDAREMFEAARDVARSAGSVRGMASAAAALSGMHLEAGDEGLALESAHAAVDAIRNKGVWMWGGDVFPEAVRVLLRTGRPDEAGELVRAFAGGIRGADAPAAEAALAECRGELARSEGRHDLALRSLSRARSTWSRLGNPYREALAEERRGLVMTEAGKREEGAARLRRSADTLRALGAARDAARVRAALRELGVVIPSPGRRGRRGYGDALSPRELEVARSAARGWTNRRIAEELFLSPKTVEHHLAAAMRKLRVSSRTALVGAIAGGDGEPIH